MTTCVTSPRRYPRRRGVTTVELAMVLPVLLLFVWAGFEFTRWSMVRHVADNASYEAARAVIVPGASVAEAQTKANDVLRVMGIRNAQIAINPSPIGEGDSEVTVTIDIPANSNGWLFNRFTNGRFAHSTTTLMTERIPAVQAQSLP